MISAVIGSYNRSMSLYTFHIELGYVHQCQYGTYYQLYISTPEHPSSRRLSITNPTVEPVELAKSFCPSKGTSKLHNKISINDAFLPIIATSSSSLSCTSIQMPRSRAKCKDSFESTTHHTLQCSQAPAGLLNRRIEPNLASVVKISCKVLIILSSSK